MSCRRPKDRAPPLYMTAVAPTAAFGSERLAHVLHTGHQTFAPFDLSDMAQRATATQIRAGFEAPTQLHPSMIHPQGLNQAEIDAWYDGVVKAAKDAAKGAKDMYDTGKKKLSDNTTVPRTVSDGKMKVPVAIHDFYTRALQFPSDRDTGMYVDKGFMPDFVMENSYSGNKVDSADDLKKDLALIGKKYPRISVKINAFLETSGGDWIPGLAKGVKGYTLIASVKADGLNDETLIDVIWLVRDVKDDGEWKIKRITHDGSFSVSGK